MNDKNTNRLERIRSLAESNDKDVMPTIKLLAGLILQDEERFSQKKLEVIEVNR